MKLKWLIPLLAVLFFMPGCQNEALKTDSRFTTDITSKNYPSGKGYVFAPDSLVLSLSREGKDIGTYQISYEILEGEGDLWLDGEKIFPGNTYTVQGEQFIAPYIPLSTGAHKLKFTFSNTDFFTEAIFSLSADDYLMSIEPVTGTIKTGITSPLVFNLNVRDGSSGPFTSTFELEGEGTGKINAIKTMSDSCLYSSNTDFSLWAGQNKIYYTPGASGKHGIKMLITNSYGYSQDFNFQFNVNNPDFTVSAQIDTIVSLESQKEVAIIVTPELEQQSGEYYMTYRFLENSGGLFLGNNPISENTTVTLEKGNNSYILIPNKEGKASIEFTVKDSHNTTKKGILQFEVVKSFIKTSIKNPERNIYTGYPTSFIFDISSSTSLPEEKKYNYSISSIPANAGTIKVNGKNYVYGESCLLPNQKGEVSFTAQTSGTITLLLTISDDQNNTTTEEITYNVSERKEEIKVNEYSPLINVHTPTLFTFDIIKSGYLSSYTTTITTYPLSAGEITINGKGYSPGMQVKATGNQVSFTPSKTGEITLNLEVTDESGRILRKEITFISDKTSLDIKITEFNKDIIAGGNASFFLILNTPGYQGEYSFSWTMPNPASGFLTVNNNHLPAGKTTKLNTQVPVPVSFTPLKTGEIPLTFIISNGLEQTEIPLVLNVRNPEIKTDITGFIPELTTNGKNEINISLQKEGYNGEYNCILTTIPENAGQIRLNHQPYHATTTIDNAAKIEFTPVKSGKITLKAIITDKFGSSVERNFDYRVEAAQLKLRYLSALEEYITFEKGTSWNFSVSKTNYTGKFRLELSGSGYKSVKVDNVLYSAPVVITDPGNVSIKILPSSFSPVSLTIKITDEQGNALDANHSFKVNNTDIDLSINNPLSEITTGQAANFTFSANKPGYLETFHYKITVSPADQGILSVAGAEYKGETLTVSKNKTIPVTFTPKKAGLSTITVQVKDISGSEKSKIITYTSTNPTLSGDIRSFSPTVSLQSPNNSYLSINCPGYKGSYKYSITTQPLEAGQFIVAGKEYAGGEMQLLNPENCKITFIPAIPGEVKAILSISNDWGDQIQQNLEYAVTNPPISLSVNHPEEETLPLDQTAVLAFNPQKENYNGKLYCEISSENCSDLQLNGLKYTTKTQIPSGTNTLSFIPGKAGKDANIVQLTISDQWGSTVAKTMRFSGAVSAMECSLINPGSTDLLPNETGEFIFTLTESTNELTYELLLSPADAGSIVVNGQPYKGSLQTPSNIPVHVSFIPNPVKNGQARITVKAKGKYGSTEKSVTFTVSNPPFSAEIKEFSEKAFLHTANSSRIELSKKGYSGSYSYNIVTKPSNAGEIKINGKSFTGEEKFTASTATLEFIPTITGEIELLLTIDDEWGGRVEKTLKYTVANPPIELSFSNTSVEAAPGQEISLPFFAQKNGYSGKLYAEISNENMAGLKLNGEVCTPNVKQEIRQGNNEIQFSAIQPGEAKLHIRITDEWGGVQEKTVTYKITNTPITVSFAEVSGETSPGQRTSFRLSATKAGYSGKLYAEINGENTTGLKLNGEIYTPSSKPEIRKEPYTNAIEFSAIQPGEAKLQIRITDEWGGIQEKTVTYKVINPAIQLSAIAGNKGEVLIGEAASLIFSGKKTGYTGKLFCEIGSTNGNNISNLTLNGAIYTPNSKQEIKGNDNNELQFFINTLGTTEILVKVSDEWGSIVEKALSYTVTNSVISLTLLNATGETSGETAPGEIVPLNLTVNKRPNTSKLFCEISGGNLDEIYLNGSIYTPNSKQEIKQGKNELQFSAAAPGEVNLNARVTDEWGGIQERTISYKCIPHEIQLVATADGEKNIKVGTAANFSFSATNEKENETLFCQLSATPQLGTLSIEGKQYREGDIFEITSGTLTKASFMPQAKGSAQITILVTDRFGTKKEEKLSYEIDYPISPLTISIEDFLPEISNREDMNISATIQEANYTNKFYCTFSVAPEQSGTLIVNGANYENKSLKVNAPEGTSNLQIRFIPNSSRTGTVNITINVLDINNQNVSKTMTFNIIEKIDQVQLLVSNLPAERIIIGNRATFNLTAQKENSQGETYSYQLSGFGVQDIKVNGENRTSSAWYNSAMQNMEISFIPNEFLYDIYLTVKVKDAAGNTYQKNIPFSKPGWEYAGIPCTFTLIREGLEGSTYDFSTRFEYYNYVMEEKRQVDIGQVSRLKLLPGEENEKQQNLEPVRIFKTADGRCRFQVHTQDFEFRWKDSPDNAKATFYLDVISEQGEILHHQEHKMLTNKNYNGSGMISLGGSFEEVFLPDYEQIKKAHIIIGFTLK